MTKILPTVGRVVWFRPNGAGFHGNQFSPGEPLAAIITHVVNEEMVNLAVFDSSAAVISSLNTPLVQDGEPVPNQSYCHWMPFQLGQAARTVREDDEIKTSNHY